MALGFNPNDEVVAAVLRNYGLGKEVNYGGFQWIVNEIGFWAQNA